MKSSILVATLILSGFCFYTGVEKPSQSVSYWLWAGITPEDAPANSELYVHQGHFSVNDGQTSFERHGLFPHPLKCTKLYLVYRIDGGLPDAKTILNIFARNIRSWQRHPVTVIGIQLDFDSPTSQLLIYSKYLEDFRKLLPKEFLLSITGLGDWAMNGNEDAMRRISSTTDEIVFQLYQGREHLPDIDFYLTALADYPLPFRIGLLQGEVLSKRIDDVRDNDNFHGTIYFIQKDF